MSTTPRTGTSTVLLEALRRDGLNVTATYIETLEQELSAANERERINEESLCHRIAVAESSLSDALAKLAITREALKGLHDDIADYVKVNHLGDVHHNLSMLRARQTLEATREAAHAHVLAKVREMVGPIEGYGVRMAHNGPWVGIWDDPETAKMLATRAPKEGRTIVELYALPVADAPNNQQKE